VKYLIGNKLSIYYITLQAD